MRAVVFCALTAVVVAAAPADARVTRFTLPVPNAGDVTLARILVYSTPVGRGPRSVKLYGRGRTPQAGTQIAWTGTVTHYSRGRQLADAVVAVARPASAHEAGPASVTFQLVGRHMLPSLLRVTGRSNARFFPGAGCSSFLAPVTQGRVQGRVLLGAWRSLSSRRFVLGALGYGCPDDGFSDDEAFDAPMAGALGTGFVTWVAPSQGSGRLCVYVHDAPGVSGELSVGGRGSGPTSVTPYSVPASGVAVIRLDTGNGAFSLSLSRNRPGAQSRVWEATAILLAPSTGPPVPVALAAAAGGC